MGKDAYYFSHDANARHDPKLMSLQLKNGMAGYGMYWVLIEMLREADGYKLPDDECTRNAFAMQTYATADQAHAFVCECIETHKLLKTDGEFIWSDSLLKRMEKKSKAGKKAADARWRNKNQGVNANALNRNANGMRNDAIKVKESKVKESKVKESKVNNIITDFFDDFKNSYPKNLSTINPECEREFLKLVSGGEMPNVIVEGAKKYDDYCKHHFGDEYPNSNYIMKAENFLRKREYKTDWEAKKGLSHGKKKELSYDF